jgi:hypothetical protein
MRTRLVTAATVLAAFGGATASRCTVGDLYVGLGLGALAGFAVAAIATRERPQTPQARLLAMLHTSAVTCFSAATITAGAGRQWLVFIGARPSGSSGVVAMFLAAALICLLMACWLTVYRSRDEADQVRVDHSQRPRTRARRVGAESMAAGKDLERSD